MCPHTAIYVSTVVWALKSCYALICNSVQGYVRVTLQGLTHIYDSRSHSYIWLCYEALKVLTLQSCMPPFVPFFLGETGTFKNQQFWFKRGAHSRTNRLNPLGHYVHLRGTTLMCPHSTLCVLIQWSYYNVSVVSSRLFFPKGKCKRIESERKSEAWIEAGLNKGNAVRVREWSSKCVSTWKSEALTVRRQSSVLLSSVLVQQRFKPVTRVISCTSLGLACCNRAATEHATSLSIRVIIRNESRTLVK
jgi:hypothetical protein